MPKFRKKPVVIEAVQFNGENALAIWAFMGRTDLVDNPELKQTDCPTITTLEGTMTATPGDWIIKGIKGEFYPCKSDVFAASYEAVAPSPTDPGYYCDQCPHAMAMHNPDGSCPCGSDCAAQRKAAQ